MNMNSKPTSTFTPEAKGIVTYKPVLEATLCLCKTTL